MAMHPVRSCAGGSEAVWRYQFDTRSKWKYVSREMKVVEFADQTKHKLKRSFSILSCLLFLKGIN
jgi:hypothetical protein